MNNQELTIIFVPLLIIIVVTTVMINSLQSASSLDPSQTSPSRNRTAITLNEDNVFVI